MENTQSPTPPLKNEARGDGKIKAVDSPKVGRPLKYKTVEDLQKIIDEYFQWCDNKTKKIYDEKKGAEYMISDPAPYTMHGLARRLGLSRQGLLDYSKRDEFLDAIKEARDMVAEDVETRLMGRTPTGAIFNLKNNFGWRDESKQEITLIGEPSSINIDTKKRE